MANKDMKRSSYLTISRLKLKPQLDMTKYYLEYYNLKKKEPILLSNIHMLILGTATFWKTLW